jgi:hypothetical protein
MGLDKVANCCKLEFESAPDNRQQREGHGLAEF